MFADKENVEIAEEIEQLKNKVTKILALLANKQRRVNEEGNELANPPI